MRAACDANHTFVPFNQERFLPVTSYMNAGQLDRLHHRSHPDLLRLYEAFGQVVSSHQPDALIVFDAPPFHPEFLRGLRIYKVLYSHDDPESSYLRNIPYLHAYNHVFYVTPTYSKDRGMEAMMRECGMVNTDLVPNGTLPFDYDSTQTEEGLFGRERDIDILFVGALYRQKLNILATVARHFRSRFVWKGRVPWMHNAYMTLRYQRLFLVRPVTFEERRKLYMRAKIALNVHNGYSAPNVGNQRLFYATANGAMLISDGEGTVDTFFREGIEAVAYSDARSMIDKLEYYLGHPDEREKIARRGYRRAMSDYRFERLLPHMANLINEGMIRMNWKRS